MYLFRLDDELSHQCLLNETLLADNFRVISVGFIGSFIASLSVIQNAAIFYIFSTSRKLRRQNYANPLLLATFDTIVSICYILSASVQVIGYHYQMESLVQIWAIYVRIAYCLHHFALTVSNFILVIASIERFLANGAHYFEVC
uniref:G_PROTEIN_RECEP_F1_2 domain-containing protein n=1 Tax=Panagrolaimus superbus TaxID=310955 RepID=A0A914Y2V6_9BILA